MQILIDDKLIHKAWKIYKRQTPELIHIYYCCLNTFNQQSGVFNLSELADTLYAYGWKSLKTGSGNRYNKIKDLNKLLQQAPELFHNTRSGIFKVNSRYRIVNRRQSLRSIDINLLSKKHKSEFYSLLIGVEMDMRTVDYKTIAHKTGFTKGRIFSAAVSNHNAGLIYKINNLAIVSIHQNRETADSERVKLFKENQILSKVIKRKSLFILVTYCSNSYSSSVTTAPLSHNRRPLLNKKHESKVFYRLKNISQFEYLVNFISPEIETDFYFRYCRQ